MLLFFLLLKFYFYFSFFYIEIPLFKKESCTKKEEKIPIIVIIISFFLILISPHVVIWERVSTPARQMETLLTSTVNVDLYFYPMHQRELCWNLRGARVVCFPLGSLVSVTHPLKNQKNKTPRWRSLLCEVFCFSTCCTCSTSRASDRFLLLVSDLYINLYFCCYRNQRQTSSSASWNYLLRQSPWLNIMQTILTSSHNVGSPVSRSCVSVSKYLFLYAWPGASVVLPWSDDKSHIEMTNATINLDVFWVHPFFFSFGFSLCSFKSRWAFLLED